MALAVLALMPIPTTIGAGGSLPGGSPGASGVPPGDGPSGAPLHKPQPQTERDVYAHAQELDATLRDAVQDLGFTLYVADAGPAPGHMRDQDLVERAARSAEAGTPEDGTWVVSPRVEAASGAAE